jgi:hypothetical protein
LRVDDDDPSVGNRPPSVSTPPGTTLKPCVIGLRLPRGKSGEEGETDARKKVKKIPKAYQECHSHSI